MMNFDVQICFASNANLSKVREQLKELVHASNGTVRFHHCFLARHHVEEKGFDTSIVDMLDEVLGELQVAHLEKYDTYQKAICAIDLERKAVADSVLKIYVLDSGVVQGVRHEIELFTNNKVITLP